MSELSHNTKDIIRTSGRKAGEAYQSNNRDSDELLINT